MKLDDLQFDASGLIPVTVQSALDQRVLMMAYMSRESIKLSLETGETHFYSRSRKEIWHKGLTSGNTQELISLHADCDKDGLLAVVRESGPACHTGKRSCFENFEALELE
jgi:phosphoribosyl-ATP pyrophosphohydrolase/phosphoribosyl-AMP cyclohydrolase